MALAALLVSALAIFLSMGTALRQMRLERSATHLILSMEILNQYLDGRFTESERFVHDQLDSNAPSALSSLPVDARSHAYKVAMMYQMIGYFAAARAVDRRFVRYLFGVNAVRSWRALKQFIEAQREMDSAGV
ncbi:MAG: DUF4760 domain-containing protein [Burkholderiales bacterium]